MFAQRLKELRATKCLTQSELADILGVSPSAIGMYEQGRREPDIGVIKKLCAVFSVSSDYLLGRCAEGEVSDVESVIGDMKARLLSADGLMFNGVPLSQKDTQKLMDAIELSVAVVLNKR